jgi:Na+/proline symporter
MSHVRLVSLMLALLAGSTLAVVGLGLLWQRLSPGWWVAGYASTIIAAMYAGALFLDRRDKRAIPTQGGDHGE